MAPTLAPGDWALAVTPSRFERGDIVVVEHPGRPGYEMVKRLIGVPGDQVGERRLASDEFWVEGDHEPASTDSRFFGPVQASRAQGEGAAGLRAGRRRRVVRSGSPGGPDARRSGTVPSRSRSPDPTYPLWTLPPASASRPAPISRANAPAPARSVATRLPPWTPRRRSPLPAAVALLVVVALLAAAVAPIFRSTDVRPRAVGTKADYSYILTSGDDPVRWNPCEPIHYVLARTGLTEGAIDDVHGAIDRLTGVTGIEFTYDGLTEEEPRQGRRSYQPGRYGDRWAPVLIAWVHPDSTDIPFSDEGHDAAAVASPQLPEGLEGDVYVSGWIAVDIKDPNPSGFSLPGQQGRGAPRARPRSGARPRRNRSGT